MAEDRVELDQLANDFLLQLDALYETAVTTMVVLIKGERKARTALLRYLEGLPGYEEENPTITLDEINYRRFRKFSKRVRKAAEARRMLAHSFLVSMVSQYDAFFSSAVRMLFKLKPEKLRARDRTITIRQIVQYDSLQELLVNVVNDEIDEVLRGSHLEQLQWLAKTFDFRIDADLLVIQAFVEITERRNICVHSDGCISKQYAERCRKLDRKLVSDRAIGEWVPIDADYLKEAHDVLFEVGLRGMQTAWRKARPDQRKEQANMLNEIGFELLLAAEYELAKRIGTYSLESRDTSDELKRILLINASIAFKFSNEKDRAIKLLDEVDWSASELKFKLAVAILKDEYDKVPELIAAIPVTGIGSISAELYRSWPLFKEARRHTIFQMAFKAKFGEPLQRTAVEIDLAQAQNNATSKTSSEEGAVESET